MKNFKTIITGAMALGAVAMTNAQQVVKRITHNANETIVELFVLRNGTALPNTTGPHNFDVGDSDSAGVVGVYNPAINDTYSQISSSYSTVPKSAEVIGNGTFVFTNPATTKQLTGFTADGGSGATLNLTIPQEDANGNGDIMNTLDDLLYSKFRLPKTLNNGEPIPNGLIVKFLSRDGTDMNTGATMPSAKQVIFQRDQATLSWLSISTDRVGYTPPVLQEIGTNGQVLGSDEFDTIETSEFIIYPNPAHQSFKLDNGDNNTDAYDIEIIDALGRKVGGGTYLEGQDITIDHLQNGNYFVIGHSEDKFTTKQFIKN